MELTLLSWWQAMLIDFMPNKGPTGKWNEQVMNILKNWMQIMALFGLIFWMHRNTMFIYQHSGNGLTLNFIKVITEHETSCFAFDRITSVSFSLLSSFKVLLRFLCMALSITRSPVCGQLFLFPDMKWMYSVTCYSRLYMIMRYYDNFERKWWWHQWLCLSHPLV